MINKKNVVYLQWVTNDSKLIKVETNEIESTFKKPRIYLFFDRLGQKTHFHVSHDQLSYDYFI